MQAVLAVRAPWLTTFMKASSVLGSWLVYLVVVGAGIAGHKHKGWSFLMIALVSLAMAQLVRLLVNVLIHRPRPPRAHWLVEHATWYSFPSGHTVLAGVGFGLAAWLVWETGPRASLAGAAAILAILVGVSRVYLGVHWASDVAGSLAFSVAWLILTFMAAARIAGS